MQGIIDRFEENFAIVELEDKRIIKLDKSIIPNKAKEGDVININITLNEKESKKLKKEIDELTEDMWKEE